jgi:uncharacterized phage-associated protein
MTPQTNHRHQDKLINAIIYFVQQDSTVKLTKLMKLLYFLDFGHYRESGYSVTGQKYEAWPKGPVPVDVWAEIRNGEDRGIHVRDVAKFLPVEQTIDAFGYDLRLTHGARFKNTPFNPREMRILRDVAYMFHNVPASRIIEATHMPGTPWKKTYSTKGEGAEIDYALALDGCDDEHIARIREDQRDRELLGKIYGVVL